MAKKTVIRAMIKYMPLSVETQDKFSADERIVKEVKAYEDGAEIESDNIIDMGDFEQPQPQQPTQKDNKSDDMTPEELAELEKEMQAAKKAQEELDAKKNK